MRSKLHGNKNTVTVLVRGNSKHGGPEVGGGLVGSKSSKAARKAERVNVGVDKGEAIGR